MQDGKPQPVGGIYRIVLIGVGCLAVGLGVAGIFLPLLPTTVFFLLAAACFVRSSESLHRRLLEHRWTGPYIRGYSQGKGMPRKAKITTVAVLWGTLGISAYLVPEWWVWLILLGVAVGVPWYLFSLPTLQE